MKNVNMLRRICFLFLLLVATAMNVSAKEYGLWIAGVQVTDENKDSIPVGSGKVSYNDNRLIIKDATITATANKGYGQAAVYSTMEVLRICVQGNCKLISNSSGIISHGSLGIEGQGNLLLDTLSIKAGTAIAMTSMVDHNLAISGDIILTLDGITNYGVLSSNGKTQMIVYNHRTEVKVRGLKECFHNLKSIVVRGGGQIFTAPNGVYVENGTVYDANGSSVKNEWVTIDRVLKHINITDYTWPTDFESADYNVRSSTKCVGSVRVDYIMYNKILENYVGHAGDKLGIRFTVGLIDGYRFADDANAYIERDGTTVKHSLKQISETANEKAFVFLDTVPTPENGLYMRTATIREITAPVIGAEPQWEIATTAGAKPTGVLPETNIKEIIQSDECPVNEIKWFEVGGKGLKRGDRFQQSKRYGVEMTLSPVSGVQFHNNTQFRVNDVPMKNYRNNSDVYLVIDSATSAKFCYVFSMLPSYLGDVNQDNVITMADANALVSYYLAKDKPSGFNERIANVNGDNSITMADANEIVNSFLSGAEPQEYTDSANGHVYVDLGLSVKWATCNVGADNPWDYGDYFLWGDTEPKSDYSWQTYKWCDNSYNTMTKYNTKSDYGKVDDKITIVLSDDAAAVNWHGAWRMPTYEEQKALCDSCYWEWTTNYNERGVSGYIVYKVKDPADRGKKNHSRETSKETVTTLGTYSLSDAHIFLPAAGRRDASHLDDAGLMGCYWSTSLYSFDPYKAYNMAFLPNTVYYNRDSIRYYGLSVRPVLP
ncbi:MAG: dockerin type I repeat-containing protein [Prevotella sp.]|nr:dockerin type I repeat-containing protein [Prevotella sp.]